MSALRWHCDGNEGIVKALCELCVWALCGRCVGIVKALCEHCGGIVSALW